MNGMPVIRTETFIYAAPSVVFDLVRDIDFHMQSTSGTGERAVAGVTSGLIGMGERVTWQARHLGVKQHLTVEITRFDPPHHLRDTMVQGAFKRFDHDHFMFAEDGGTRMLDVFDYTSPLAPLGRLADVLFLERYMLRFLEERNRMIKEEAERVSR